MTKKELSQLYYLNREIDFLKRQLGELKAKPPSCTASQSIGGGGVSDKVGNYVAQMADVEELIELNIRKCEIEYRRLNTYIQSVTDSQVRMILTLRYINGFGWQQIAMHLGGGNTADGTRMIHNRFLRG